MESISRFCGLQRNETYTPFDKQGGTFTQCFLWTATSSPSHAILAIVCAYLLGITKRQVSQRTCCLLLLMNTVTLLLAVTSLTELIISYAFHHSHPPAYVLSKTLSFTTWLLCFWVQIKVKGIVKQKKQTNQLILCAFLLVFVSTSLQLHYVIKHITKNKLSLKEMPSDYFGTISFFALNCVFLILCIYLSFMTLKRKTLNRSLPSLASNLSIQAFDGEEYDGTSGLLSSSASQGAYYEVYRKHKEQHTDIYLGKAGSSNILSKALFWWAGKLISKGYHQQLEKPDDLFILPDTLDTNMIKERLTSMLRIQRHQTLLQSLKTDTIEDYHVLKKRKRSYKVSILKSLSNAFGTYYFSLGILKFFRDGVGFVGPILLNLLVSYIENQNEPVAHGYYYAFGLFLSSLLGVFTNMYYQYNIRKVGMQVRAGLVTTIYEKTLAVSKSTLSAFSTGQIVNFMSTDANRVVNFTLSFHEFWSLPFQIAICLYLLYQQVGVAFLSGLVFIILLVPLNKFLTTKIGKISEKMMGEKDTRVKIISEILHGIRIIKLYAWESHFMDKVDEARSAELKSLKTRKYTDAWCVYFWATTPVLISILTFGTYVLMGNELTAAKVFTCIALFNMLIAPINAFPWVLNGLIEAWVSLKRIEKYLALREVNQDEYYTKSSQDDDDHTVFEMEHASFGWKEKEVVEIERIDEKQTNHDQSTMANNEYNVAKPFHLQNIDIAVEKGQFLGITGKVGSGKSSLFAAITAEMEKESGYIYLSDDLESFAFVTQEPWIQHLSVRDNVLFGRPYDPERYEQVLYACALNEDINLLPAGDFTEVGENGVTLSGGQKARLSLARAVYQDKEVYLLDDPIAAVDSHVAAHIFKHCIMGLLKDKTRLLCTHHTKYLHAADAVLLLDDGLVNAYGDPQNVLTTEDLAGIEEKLQDENSSEHTPLETYDDVMLNSSNIKDDNKKGKLIDEEKKAKGTVLLSVYKSYWQSVGNILAASIVLFLFLMQASRNISDWWLAYWISHTHIHTNASYTSYHTDIESSSYDVKFYLYVYIGLAIGNTVFTFFRAFLFAYGGIQAAMKLHKKLLRSILNAPAYYFDVTPIGRIINRFSSDVYSVDDALPFVLNIMLSQLFSVVGTIIITCYGIPWFAAVLVPLGAIYYYTQHYYRITSRELKRLSSVTLSPIYEHFTETLSGLMTIRAFGESHRFIAENERKLDFSQRADYSGLVAKMWLRIRLEMIGVAMVTSVAFFAVLEHHFNSINPGLVGLAVSYALAITPKVGGLVSSFTEYEKQMVSVERVLQYIDETPQEEDGSFHIDLHWPQQGVICFRNVFLKYRPNLPDALEDVSFYVRAGEKIGICGRTGSGKSSLFRLLFKTVKLSQGEIIIDGVNIKNIHASQMRSQMSIIPQDPFLFDDSISMNLDPKQQYTSFEIHDVLEKCHLTKLVSDLGGLDGTVGERGQNLSTGQKQLLCLARALLKKSKIICIDEATASVDFNTDHLIQETIRTEFASSTVLTIAHRIDTIMDSDRVLVMNAGHAHEFAPPLDLLSDHESMFFSLVRDHSSKMNATEMA